MWSKLLSPESSSTKTISNYTVSAIHVIYYYYCCFSLMQLLYSGVYAKQDLILLSLVLFVDYWLSKVTYQLGRKFFSEKVAGFVPKITGMKA